MQMPRALTLVSLCLASGCSKEAPKDPLVAVGAFSVPVPDGWRNVTDSQLGPGKVALETVEQAVTIVYTPAPEPLSGDPTDPDQCTAATVEEMFDGSVRIESAKLVDLAAGKACEAIGHRGPVHLSQLFLLAGGHGISAACTYRGDDAARCESMFQQITTRTGS